MKKDTTLEDGLKAHAKMIDALIAEAYNNGFEDGQEYAQVVQPERNPEPDG